MKRVLYLVQKEFRQLFREKLYLRIIFISPFIQLVIMGFAITTDVKNLPISIVDLDNSIESRRIIDAFSITESFDFKGMATNEKSAISAMNNGDIKLALIIPSHFSRNLAAGRRPQVQAIVDGVDGNTAGVALAYVNQVAMGLQQEWMGSSGINPLQHKQVHITQIEPRMLYNPSLESVNNIVPGIIVVLLMVITSFLTGMSIVREREIGTMEQLSVTPIKKFELIVGKVIPFAVVGFVLFNIGILGAGLIFGLWMKGNLLSLYLMSIVFMLSTLGIGIFSSTIARTQQQAMFISWFFMVFAILLSGFFIPIENMPDIIQAITYLNPVRFFMVVVREIYMKGTSIIYLWQEAIYMAAFGIIFIGLASMRFSKRVE